MQMGQILIRKVNDDLLRKLKARAKAAGRSAEAEAREVLKAALTRGSAKLGRLIGSGKHSGRTVKQVDKYIRKLRNEWR
jgi:plasmid stability protein